MRTSERGGEGGAAMRGGWVLVTKHVLESRWLLGLSALALFLMSWLSVYAASRQEEDFRLIMEVSKEREQKTAALGEGAGEGPSAGLKKLNLPTEEQVGMIFATGGPEGLRLMSDQLHLVANDLRAASELMGKQGDRIPTPEELEAALGTESSRGAQRLARRLRDQGQQALPQSGELELFFWNFPAIILPVLVWGIARGSIAVAGELERGTLDIVLSRPISRTAYYFSQILAMVLGLLFLLGALIFGNVVASAYFTTSTPPSLLLLSKPALNLGLLVMCVYSVTLAASSRDLVRWRSTMIGSSFALISSIMYTVAQLRQMVDYKAMLEGMSIFTLYQPVNTVKEATTLLRDCTILTGVTLSFLIIGWFFFNRRDLPSNT